MKILIIAGLVLLFIALLINPVAPLLTSVPVPASINIPAGPTEVAFAVSNHAGWQVAFKSNGMVAQSLDFYFKEPVNPSQGKIIVTRNAGSTPEQLVYLFDVTVAQKVHVSLPGISVAGETWSFEFIALDSNAAILQALSPPSPSGDLYTSITSLGNAIPGFTLSGTKDMIVRGPEARFSYETKGLVLTVRDESTNADVSNWSWGDGTFSTGTGTLTHTYAANGTYTVVLNARSGSAHDSAQATITVSGVADAPPVTGDTGSKDVRLPVFIGLLVGGIVLILIGRRVH